MPHPVSGRLHSANSYEDLSCQPKGGQSKEYPARSTIKFDWGNAAIHRPGLDGDTDGREPCIRGDINVRGNPFSMCLGKPQQGVIFVELHSRPFDDQVVAGILIELNGEVFVTPPIVISNEVDRTLVREDLNVISTACPYGHNQVIAKNAPASHRGDAHDRQQTGDQTYEVTFHRSTK